MYIITQKNADILLYNKSLVLFIKKEIECIISFFVLGTFITFQGSKYDVSRKCIECFFVLI